jgi:hypothetical protein
MSIAVPNNNSTKSNHFLSRFFSNNFRTVENEPMWVLDCKTGSVSNRKTSENKLFAKRNAWAQSLEDAFGAVENQVSQLIASLLNAPYNVFQENIKIDTLSEKYNIMFNYTMQTLMMQLSNTNNLTDEYDLTMIETALKMTTEKSIFNHYKHPFLIRYNYHLYVNEPLVLIDNAVSIYIAPSIDSSSTKNSVCWFMPISPYFLAFAGLLHQLRFFLRYFPSPHKVNLYRILSEDKKCLVASQNKDYIKWISTEYKYFSFNDKGTQIKTQRVFE